MKVAFDRARQAIDILERHRLYPSAANFHLMSECLAAPKSALALEIGDLTDGGLRLTTEQAADLVTRHLGGQTHSNPVQEEQLSSQTSELRSLTTSAHELTTSLGRDVGEFAAERDNWPQSADGFVGRLTQAERELADMRSEIAALHGRISAGQDNAAGGDRDELTDALNQQGARALLSRLSEDERSYVLMLFSLDDLAGLNDRFGLAVGNNVLNALASTLRQTFPHQELMRWSGNEFLVVMTETALAAVRLMTREALTALEERRLKLRGSGEWIGVVTASAAIAVGRGDPDLVLARARKMLVDSGGGERNRIES